MENSEYVYLEMYTFKIGCGIGTGVNLGTVDFGQNNYDSTNNVAYVNVGVTSGYVLPTIMTDNPT